MAKLPVTWNFPVDTCIVVIHDAIIHAAKLLYIASKSLERLNNCLMGMEGVEEVVIVGGGICGMATTVALMRYGIKALVLEKAESLRATGAALTLDALGVSHKLHPLYSPLTGYSSLFFLSSILHFSQVGCKIVLHG